jgi:adenosylcobinamide-phosphate synthase
MLIALCIDRLFGWPDFLFRRFSHPVVGIGQLISFFERNLNKTGWSSSLRMATGLLTLIFLMTGLTILGFLIVLAIPAGTLGILVTSFLVWPFIAAKSLADHVKAVAEPLKTNDLPSARQAVSMIVGRNSDNLGSNDIARAALESLAENTSDGVTAPLFWGVLLGFPGVLIYKFVNTADSMIGYKSERYRDFGWASARFDDLINYIPARLTSLIYAIISRNTLKVLRITLRDASQHRSPNAGWPETSVAASIGVKLSGPRIYDGIKTNDPWLNSDGRNPTGHDLFSGLRLFDHFLWAITLLLLSCSVISFA